jgi:hypothetical protein
MANGAIKSRISKMLDHNSLFFPLNSGKWSSTPAHVLKVTVGEVVRMKEQNSYVMKGMADPGNGFIRGKINVGIRRWNSRRNVPKQGFFSLSACFRSSKGRFALQKAIKRKLLKRLYAVFWLLLLEIKVVKMR